MSIKHPTDTNEYAHPRRPAYVRVPASLLALIFITLVSYAGGSAYLLVRKDNEIEKFRRLEIELQNQIKERDQQLLQKGQQIDQLGRRLEILDAVKQISSADVSHEEQVRIANVVYEQSEAYGHDPFMLISLMSAESSLRPWAESHVGAKGLMQLMPSTGTALASMVNNDPTLVGMKPGESLASLNLSDIESNVKLGTLYFTKLTLKYNSVEEAIYAYNLGPYLYERRKREGGSMPTQYYSKIMRTYHALVQSQTDKASREIPTYFADARNTDALLVQADVSR